MKTRHWLLLLLAGLGWPGLPRGAAQEALAEVAPEVRNQSHAPVPFSVGSPDEAQRFLAQRLRNAKDLAGLQRMLDDPAFRKLAEEVARDPKRFGVEDQVNQLRRNLPQQARPDLSDPRWQKLMASALQAQAQQAGSGAGIPPKQSEDWQRLLRDLTEHADTPGGGRTQPDGSGPQSNPTPDVPRPAPGAHPPLSSGRPPPSPNPEPEQSPSVAPPPPAPERQPQRGGTANELLKFADRLQNADSSLKKSPALHDFLRKLSRYAESADTPTAGREGRFTGRLRDRVRELARSLHVDRLHSDPQAWSRARSLLPQPPHVTLHPERFGGVSPPTWSAPRPTRAEAGGLGQFVLLLAAVVGFAVLLARLLARHQARRTGGSARGWRLGPWPVHPAAVRTRAELVQAFDHLALLLLGPVARSCNHLIIAARLAEGRKPDRRRAAAALATLYEQARYAPPDEALADADLAAARRDLCLLAGVHAA
jgi:hypothetical protein